MSESQSFYRSELSGRYTGQEDPHIGNFLTRKAPVRSLDELAAYYRESDVHHDAVREIESEEFIPAGFTPPKFTGMNCF